MVIHPTDMDMDMNDSYISAYASVDEKEVEIEKENHGEKNLENKFKKVFYNFLDKTKSVLNNFIVWIES